MAEDAVPVASDMAQLWRLMVLAVIDLLPVLAAVLALILSFVAVVLQTVLILVSRAFRGPIGAAAATLTDPALTRTTGLSVQVPVHNEPPAVLIATIDSLAARLARRSMLSS